MFCSCKSNPTVTVKEGTLRGSINNLLDGGIYYSFKGIPYARPPLGELRFKDPLPPQAWIHEYDATKHGAICVQFDAIRENITKGSEDCLFLNIYTKYLKTNSKFPVMVYIHGGTFMLGNGNSDLYGPEFLLQHDVLVATINYRLEAFGFLSLNIPEVPGNAGMKDQVAALKWIKKNIARFGGDPDNITIFGESSGAASVTLHLMSPMSKGLFHKAIAQSGTSLSDITAFGKYGKKTICKVSTALNIEARNKNEYLQILQNITAKDLAGITYKLTSEDKNGLDTIIFFHPTVENSFNGVEAFMNEQNIIDMLVAQKTNAVPLMIGYNSAEVYTKQPVYMYRFNYDTDLNYAKIKSGGKDKKGVAHADDLFYLFHNKQNDDAYKTQDKLKNIIFNLTKMWTDFAKTGNPTPDGSLGITWMPLSSDNLIMKLEEPLSLGPIPDMESLRFWDNLYCEVGLPCLASIET
ncbi:juvenile hormone esterase-like [Amyelois transitella]|uniref:juvenile hormone esterase-like n=1 Tax=Amyelois transitella TaxID=680683 RepID=UPI00298FD4CC|nr:juvenile hormone esterase-like [Amyelois transitella]